MKELALEKQHSELLSLRWTGKNLQDSCIQFKMGFTYFRKRLPRPGKLARQDSLNSNKPHNCDICEMSDICSQSLGGCNKVLIL